MADITINTATISIADNSLLNQSSLKQLASGTIPIEGRLQQSIKDVDFQSALLGARFTSPKIALDGGLGLTIDAGTNCTLTRYTAKDGTLLGSTSAVPRIDIGPGTYWMSFALQTTADVGASATLPNGFGVALKLGSEVKLSEYASFPADGAAVPTFGQAISATLSNFGVLRSAADIREQKAGTIRASDVTGTVTVSGSYSLPISVNQLALAESHIPFKFEVQPALAVTAKGSVAITGEYSVLCWRGRPTEAVLVLMKKQGTTLTGSFSVGAGLKADEGGTDLLAAFFTAIAPGVDLAKTPLAADKARASEIKDALKDCTSRALSISLNAACSAAFSDQIVFMYSIDLSAGDAAKTDAALNSAIGGDWSVLSTTPGIRELRNVVADRHETKATLGINLLGIFNYETVADFIGSSTVVHDEQTGSITVTDTATATRITVATSSVVADADKLRGVVDDATIATAAYSLAGGKLTSSLELKQSLLIYEDKMSASDLRKSLLLAVAIDELSSSQLAALQMVHPRHVLIDANQSLSGDHMMKLFFSDPSSFAPHSLAELTLRGRQSLAALLNPSEPVDARRISVLLNQAEWQHIDDNHGSAPSDSPASYTDWFVVTSWANAMFNAAKPLKDVLMALQSVPAGVDPSTDNALTKSRAALKHAISGVTHRLHAPFDPGWPIAVNYALSGRKTGAIMRAAWNGVQVLPISQPPPAVASLARTVATQAAPG